MGQNWCSWAGQKSHKMLKKILPIFFCGKDEQKLAKNSVFFGILEGFFTSKFWLKTPTPLDLGQEAEPPPSPPFAAERPPVPLPDAVLGRGRPHELQLVRVPLQAWAASPVVCSAQPSWRGGVGLNGTPETLGWWVEPPPGTLFIFPQGFSGHDCLLQCHDAIVWTGGGAKDG